MGQFRIFPAALAGLTIAKEKDDMAKVRELNVPERGLPSLEWSAVSYIGDGTMFFRSFR